MRFSRPYRMLIALVLVTWMPWCLCKWAPNACGAAHLAEAASSATDSCCSHGCCEGSGDEAPATPADKPCNTCPSACCAPKFHVVHALPDVPCDDVGLVLPIDLLPSIIALSMVSDDGTAAHPEWPPGRPPGLPSDGRSVLLLSSVLRT